MGNPGGLVDADAGPGGRFCFAPPAGPASLPANPHPMRSLLRLVVLSTLVATAVAAAEPAFPGLRAIMSAEAWQQARLDRLDAADLRLVDAAFAQYLREQKAPAPAAPAPTAEKRSPWARFGLGAAPAEAAAERLVMTAKVTALRGSNGFELDNGQVWAGIDLIRVELLGREVAIQEGKLGSFLLIVDGRDTNVRLRRLK